MSASSSSQHRGDAVLADVRTLNNLPVVLQNVRAALPSSWLVNFLHGDRNHEAIRATPALRASIDTGTLLLRHLSTVVPLSMIELVCRKHRVIVPNRKKDPLQANLLYSSAFWTAFSAPRLLLFQPDTAFCPKPSRSLHSFDRFTMVGAPWIRCNLPKCVGNSGLSLWEVGIPVGVRGGLKERNKDFAPQAVDALGADAFGGRDVIVVCERGGSLVRDCIPAGSSISIEDTKAVSLQACYELAQCGVTGLRYIEGGLNEYYETQEVAGGILKGEGGPKNPDADWPGNWEWFGYRQFKFKDPRKGRREF